MRVILIGAPGAGKGTQAQFISRKLNIPQISTGDILRSAIQAQTALGKEVDSILATGNLVSDDIMITLIKKRIAEPDCIKGFLFDGFPRTIPQAESLIKENIYIDHVIEIYVDDDEIINRLGGRRIHPESGRIYHNIHKPPRVPDKDDITGEPLIKRKDDQEATIIERIAIYRDQTEPLVNFYKKMKGDNSPIYHQVNGNGSVEEIKARINATLFAP